MFMHTHAFKNSVFSIRFLLYVLVIYALLVVPFVLLLNNEKQAEIQRYDDQLRVQYATQLTLFSNKLNKQFENLAWTSELLAGSRVLYNFINKPEASKQTLIDTWGRLMLGHGELRQIRFIDLQGYEKVRVDYTLEGGLKVADELQNKSNQDFFKYASLMKEPWAFYGADLESERGEYVKPYTMAMRILVPVSDEDNVRLGFLVVNLAIEQIFGNILSLLDLDDTPIILGKNSDYLFGMDDSMLFGMKIDDRSQHTLENDKPDFWKKVQSKKQGVYREENIYTVFDRINLPLPGLGVAKLTVLHDYSDLQVEQLAFNHISQINAKQYVGAILFLLLALPIALFALFYREVIRHSNLSYAAMKSMSPMMVTNSEGVIEQVNESYCRVFDTSVSDSIGTLATIFLPDTIHHDIYDSVKHALEISGEWHGEVLRLSKQGGEHIDYVEVYAFDTTKGAAQNYAVSLHDITEEKKLKNQLQLLTVTDPLTGCKNRRFYENAIAHELESFKRYPEQIFCLAVVDIDHFKKVNDEYGHDVGDRVIKSFVKFLESCVRNIDMVCRVGGEEFAVILPNTNAKNASILFERMRSTVELGDIKPKITCSIGYCECDKSDTPDTLYKRADAALYQAKHTGRNCVIQGISEIEK
jgi:diguanylate cyclase (GGDEF)-like protein/PAS domain S-box-containing protein